MTTRAAELAVPLAGVPEGLSAHPLYQYRLDGEVEVAIKSRRGHHKVQRVALRGRGGDGEQALAVDRAFVLGADRRRWPAVAARFGQAAWERSQELARAGVVDLICAVDDRLRLGDPLGWELTDQWRGDRRRAADERTRARQGWSATAASLVDRCEERWPDLAAALRASAARPDESRAEIVVRAAEDLLEGVRHDSPRAFSQAHWNSTKVREGAPGVLLAAGVLEVTLVELGLTRSKYIGVSGVRAAVDGAEIALDLLRGPALIRCEQPRLALMPAPGSHALVIVENLQAAEALSDRVPCLAVAYTAGLLSRAALRVIAQLATGFPAVAVIPDADLGGVRIAEQVLSACPVPTVIDIGAEPHPAREPFQVGGVSERGLRAALDGPAGTLALAVLTRGYPVEQEIATVSAVKRWSEALA